MSLTGGSLADVELHFRETPSCVSLSRICADSRIQSHNLDGEETREILLENEQILLNYEGIVVTRLIASFKHSPMMVMEEATWHSHWREDGMTPHCRLSDIILLS